MTLQEQMARCRATRNLSCKQAAEKCGISYPTWRMVESGKTDPGRFVRAKIELFIEAEGGEVDARECDADKDF